MHTTHPENPVRRERELLTKYTYDWNTQHQKRGRPAKKK